MGFSEGCKLAGLATGRKKIKPAGLVLAACFPDDTDSGDADWSKDRRWYEKTMNRANGITMPTLLLSNKADSKSNTNSHELAQVLTNQATPVITERIPGKAGHEIFYDHTAPWVNTVSKFIRHQKPYQKLFN